MRSRTALSVAALGLFLLASPCFARTDQAPAPRDSTATPSAAQTASPAQPEQPAPAPVQTAPPAAAPSQVPPPAAPPAQTTPAAQAPPAQVTPPPAHTEAPPSQQPTTSVSVSNSGAAFSRGTNQLRFTAGWGRSFDDDYLLLGLGAARYLKTGLAAGLHLETWLGSDPGITKLTPELTYVLVKVPRLKPYVGGFYTRNFIKDHDDLNSMGARAGAYKGAGRASLGGGVVWEKYLNCDFGDCTTVYPEIFASTSF
jgi:hypothetical protein